MVVYDGESTITYLFTKNMHGDITRIVNANGTLMVSYTYDMHGNRTATYNSDTSNPLGVLLRIYQMVISTMNPFGYRGYCYDANTGLYYLQSRYYDPNTGRFINADSTDYLNVSGTVLGCNLFIYCENDPVNNVDPTGESYASTASYLLPALYGSILALKLAKSALIVKIGALITAIAPYLIAVAIAVAAAVLIYYTARVITAQKADAKIKNKVTRNSKTRYWSATVNWSHVDIGRALTYAEAVSQVKKGNSIFTVTKQEAEMVARVAGGNKKPVLDPKHKNQVGYYNHFHINGRKNSSHIYYLFG